MSDLILPGDPAFVVPPFRSVRSGPDGRFAVPITTRPQPVDLKALESFTVQITTPPATCRRCSGVLQDRKGHVIQPNRAEINRLAEAEQPLILYFFCDPCATEIVASCRAGTTCYHGAPTGQACEGCNPPPKEAA